MYHTVTFHPVETKMKSMFKRATLLVSVNVMYKTCYYMYCFDKFNHFCSVRSDFMEKYFDLYDNEAVDLHYGTTTVYTEVKKDSS